MDQHLPPPSAKLASHLQQELGKPEYQGKDPDEAHLQAVTAILKTYGADAFDPLNPTDQILKNLAELE